MRALHSNNGMTGDTRMGLVYVSVGESDADVFTEACRGLGWMDVRMETVGGNSESLDRDEERFIDLLSAAREADMVLMKIHGDRSRFAKFDRLMNVVRSRGTPLLAISTSVPEMSDLRRMFPYPDSDYDRGSSFLHVGGTRNYTSLHLWACRLLTGRDVHIPDLDLPPAQGIYHRTKGVRMRGREFLDSVDTSRPVIGIMMSQRTAMTEETEAVDALIDALVSRGASVIPVFLKSTRGGLDGSIGTEACIKRYFMKGRKPVVDAVVVCTGFSQRILGSGEDGRNPFGILGVPVIQAPSVYRPVAEWRMDNLGLGPMEMSVNVVQTEYDGQILSAPLGFITGRGNGRECAFVPDRVSMIADSTLAWSRLRRKPKGEARIAIVLNPFSGESSEPARGLDSVESLRLILKAMGRSGYEIDSIPGDRREMWRLMCRTSCHSDPGEGYVMPDDVSPDCYRMWLGEVPRGIRERMEADFGTVEGLMPIHIPGFIDGNVFIGLEPDPSIGSHHVFSHDYLAFYRWIERTFRADAIVHLGDRSKLDGLPGKETGLTSTCLPDIILGPMVRICPFAVDDIRNGLVAKRRTHSVLIGHLTPPEERMGTSMGMDELEARLQDIMMGEGSGSMNDVRSMIDSLNLWREVGLDPGCSDGDIRGIAPRIYDYITELRNESVTDGLHVFGSGLRGTRLRKAVMESLRFSNGNIPSLPSVLAGNRGLDLEWMMREPSGITEGHLNAELLESVENESQRIVDSMAERGFRADGCMELFPDDPQIGKIAKFVCSSLVPSLKGCSGEMSSLMTALAGGFVEPGPSGFPYRGGAHILPTGRNFHGSDPRRIPDEAGWRRGSEMAEQIVSSYVSSEGSYPEKIAVVIGGGSTISGGGSDIACAMRLVGMRPVWSSYGGAVCGVVPIPVSELDRPRVDARLSVSPFAVHEIADALEMFRDGLEAVCELDDTEVSAELRRRLRERLTEDVLSCMTGGKGLKVERFDAAVANHLDESDGDGLRMIMSLDLPADRVFINDDGTNGRIRVMNASDEVARVVRTRIMAGKWVNGLMPYGAEGARRVASLVTKVLRWSGIAGATEPWMFVEISKALVMDAKRREWLADSDPASACEIAGCLLEAAKEGLWIPDDGTESVLRDMFLESDGMMEDSTA